MWRAGSGLWRSDAGAVAPIVAISLFGLIAAGGLAFDYARLASLDTELQSAADEAALAAATQLNGRSGTQTRAISAAQSLITNRALFANDGANRNVSVPTVLFYQDKAKATPATGDANSNFVEVTVGTKRAFYALTPVVAVFQSAPIAAKAFAGLGTAICKVPPVMICNPDEPIGNTNVNVAFNANAYVGAGIRLIGDGSYAPGNFGFLDSAIGNGASNLLKSLGWNALPIDCQPTTGVSTKTGLDASVIDGLNTRFDIDANGSSCPGGGTCSPSINTRKDLVRGNACGITGNGWAEVDASNGNFQTQRYRPTDHNLYPATTTPAIMGYPRDACHAWSLAGDCTAAGGKIGNGSWDRDAYFRSNYGWTNAQWTTNTGLSATATRYKVYDWETGHPGQVTTPQSLPGNVAAYSRPVAGQCLAPGVTPGGAIVDRRRISAAVLNCQALNIHGASSNLPVLKWVDLFLVEPSVARTKCKSGGGCNTKYTDKTDVYVEMIGETGSGTNGATASQIVRRDVPYLIE
jgi:Flp pilus assembly protein TadG